MFLGLKFGFNKNLTLETRKECNIRRFAICEYGRLVQLVS